MHIVGFGQGRPGAGTFTRADGTIDLDQAHKAPAREASKEWHHFRKVPLADIPLPKGQFDER